MLAAFYSFSVELCGCATLFVKLSFIRKHKVNFLHFLEISIIRFGSNVDMLLGDEKKHCVLCVISGFRREVNENCALLGYYTASSASFLPTFRDIPSVPFSGTKNPNKNGDGASP